MMIIFKEVIGWGDEPWDRDVTGVAVDSHDRVHVMRRGGEPIKVLHPDGRFIGSWGEGCFSDRPHLLSIDERDTAYVADDGGHRICVFDSAGHLVETIGSGIPSATGFDAEAGNAELALDRIVGGPPFNRPTKAVALPNGELLVSDGYRNCRIHRFSSQRELLQSWGSSGVGDGCFVIPHSVSVDDNGRVLVCDRENDRVQIFTLNGELIDVWNTVQRPTDIAFDRLGGAYVAELPRGPDDLKSWRLGRAKEELAGRVSIRSRSGEMIGEIRCPGVKFLAPHAVAIDSTGAVYVAEIPQALAAYTGKPVKLDQPHRCLRKFVRRHVR